MNESLIKKIKPSSILVAGDVMVDEYVLGEVERISPESPVPVLVARERLRRLGGAGNVLRNLVSMGATVALFATIGSDDAGKWFKNHCYEIGVDTFWLKTDRSRPTTIKTRVVARNQQIVRIDEENTGIISAEMEQKVIDELKSVLPQVKAVVLSDYGKGFLTPNILQSLLAQAKEENIPVLVDPKGMDFTRYNGATYITPNIREASLASGIAISDKVSMELAGQTLLSQTNAEGIVLTRGRDGSSLITRNNIEHFTVKPVEIVDVTGAGDTVISTLALAVASGLSIQEAIQLANLAASLVVARFGAATVSLDEMIDSLKLERESRKIINMSDAERALRHHRIQGHTIVFTNGCYDLFHAGHLELLRKASSFGDVLVVGVNSDKSVKRIKGPQRPIVPEGERLAILSALNFVDYVIAFDQDTPLELIKEIRPDVLVKGEDWKGKTVVGEKIVLERGGRVELVKLLPGVSTTELISRIKKS